MTKQEIAKLMIETALNGDTINKDVEALLIVTICLCHLKDFQTAGLIIK